MYSAMNADPSAPMAATAPATPPTAGCASIGLTGMPGTSRQAAESAAMPPRTSAGTSVSYEGQREYAWETAATAASISARSAAARAFPAALPAAAEALLPEAAEEASGEAAAALLLRALTTTAWASAPRTLTRLAPIRRFAMSVRTRKRVSGPLAERIKPSQSAFLRPTDPVPLEEAIDLSVAKTPRTVSGTGRRRSRCAFFRVKATSPRSPSSL